MNGKTHTIRRIATAIALATTTATLVAPAALAHTEPNYGPPDTWALPYLTASPGAFATDTLNSARVARASATGQLPTRFTTDTLNSARVAQRQLPTVVPTRPATGKPNYGPPDPWAFPYLTASPGAFVTDTLNSARVAHASGTGQLLTAVSGSFNWSSFAIGIGAGIGGLLALGGIAARSGKLRRLANA